MKGSEGYIPDPELDPANSDSRDFSTNESAVVLPVFSGEQIVNARWFGPLYNQFTKPAPVDSPGKK